MMDANTVVGNLSLALVFTVVALLVSIAIAAYYVGLNTGRTEVKLEQQKSEEEKHERPQTK